MLTRNGVYKDVPGHHCVIRIDLVVRPGLPVSNHVTAIPAAKKNVSNAFRNGVTVALGTDAGVYPHGENGGEFWSMVQLGLTPSQALQAGTINAANLLGWSDRGGSISKGKFADIVAVRLLRHVQFVMKDGTVYKDEISHGGTANATPQRANY